MVGPAPCSQGLVHWRGRALGQRLASVDQPSDGMTGSTLHNSASRKSSQPQPAQCNYTFRELCGVPRCRESTVRDALEIGRWIFLGVIAMQLIGLIVAISMKTCCYRDGDDYEDFEAQAEEAATARAQAENVKAQVRHCHLFGTLTAG